MNTNTFTIHYYLRADKKPKENKYPIYCRITLMGQRGEIAIKRYIEKVRWDHKAQRVKGGSIEAREINSRILETTTKLNNIETKLIANDIPVTKDAILNKYHGRDIKHKTLMEAFAYHNSIIKERIGDEYAPATYKRYETTKGHIKNFLKENYHKEDLPLRQLTFEFITSLEHYFKTVRKCNHNTTMKYIKNFKKIIHLALNNGWLDKDPFRSFKTSIKEVKREILTQIIIKAVPLKAVLLYYPILFF